MPLVSKTPLTIIVEKAVSGETTCYHCGTVCPGDAITAEGKAFCCEGCRLVFELLDQKGLCDYYKLQNHPGLSQIKSVRSDKYAYLDNEDIAARIYSFNGNEQAVTTLYIPGIHCSSCMWLLEHLPRLDAGIIESRLNFTTKEVTIRFSKTEISLRKVVELLSTIGYEPYISLDSADGKKNNPADKKRIYKLGVAGFCFGNIMMMSFPEYLSHTNGIDPRYALLFRVLNLILSVPVFFYCASEFFTSAWSAIRQRILNIDAPIALALVITYARSIYEIGSGTGSGYLDSLSGITFFMLAGRIVQERTYRSISFHRDYKAYFPIAVNVLTADGVINKSLEQLREKDTIRLHDDEIIPADSVLMSGKANIDYSFVTGESEPVRISEGQIVYAGGKQTGGEIIIQVVRPVAGSYLTSLWNHHAFRKNKSDQNRRDSIIQDLSRYFTLILFVLAAITAVYWWVNDPSRILPSVSAMLIIACPCALLLSATYTNGNLLRIFSNNGLFLRDATVIEQLGNIDHIVFDKTGTLTTNTRHVGRSGHVLDEHEKNILYNVVAPSKHPYSRALAEYLGQKRKLSLDSWQEYTGRGIAASVNDTIIRVGSAEFTEAGTSNDEQAAVYVRINDKITSFEIGPDFRDSMPRIISALNNSYRLSLLSGDNNRQQPILQEIFGKRSELLFGQRPADKLDYIEELQRKARKVMMVGDGLNDAGALQQSNVGITLADDINNFTPSCDAILDAKRFSFLPALMKLAKAGRFVVNLSFAISLLYNIAGLYIAVQGKMSPMIAAILMPASTLTIVLITAGVSSIIAKSLGLSLRNNN